MGGERFSLNKKIKQTETVSRHLLIAVAFLLCSFRQANSQSAEWAIAMVGKEKLQIDLGAVAKGQDVEIPVQIKNIYKEEVRIDSLRSSGALYWDSGVNPILIPSGAARTVMLRLDSVRHTGSKSISPEIDLSVPQLNVRESVRLQVKGYIRSDIVLAPSAADFHSIEPAKAAELRLTVRYAGRDDWQIMSATCANPYVATEIKEKSRQNGRVDYEVVVRIKETVPLGRLSDRLIIATDDKENSELSVRIAARIEPDIVATDVNFGRVLVGESKSRQALLRNSRTTLVPFKIKKFESSNHRISLQKSDQPDIAKMIHVLPLTISFPDIEGPFEDEVSIIVDSQKDPIVFKVRGDVEGMQTDPDEK